MFSIGNERQTINAMDSESTVERYSRYLQDFNKGSMKALQTNPDDDTTTCVTKTVETNVLVDILFKGENYSNGAINQAEFTEKAQITTFALMDQFENCGVNGFLIVLDGALNDIPRTTSALSSAGTQLALGYETKDTSLYLAVEEMETAANSEDFEKLGEGAILLVS